MKETLFDLRQFSDFGGQLVLDEVKGTTDGNLNPENNVDTAVGEDRTMYTYIPASGCPHPKQTPVLMVLRDQSSEASAAELMKDLALDTLAEENHFILLCPNPVGEGWHYEGDAAELEKDFLIRCFAALKGAKGHTAGFNGMIYYIAASESASALVTSLAATRPLDCAAMMVGSMPEGFDRPVREDAPTMTTNYETLTAETVAKAWDEMFSEARRWRNDVTGTYQPRVNFGEKGFQKVEKFDHLWYEYVPEQLRDSIEPAPLVLYLHGINCCGLYGAEQSGWVDLADRDGLLCAFPEPAVEERWNVYGDPRLPDDMQFLLDLIEDMKARYAVDTSRIYISGFSMGSAMTNTMVSCYPEVFAGAIACNGPFFGYLSTVDSFKENMLSFRPDSQTLRALEPSDAPFSPMHELADVNRDKAIRMPIVQYAGAVDALGFGKGKTWPVKQKGDSDWIDTLLYWKQFNNIPEEPLFSEETLSGFAGDEVDRSGRFERIHLHSADEGNPELYRFVLVERLPHAVDPKEIAEAWEFIRGFRREGVV